MQYKTYYLTYLCLVWQSVHMHVYQYVQKSEENVGCLVLCFFALFPLDRVSSEPGASLEDRMSQWSISVFHTMICMWVLGTRIQFMQALLAVTLSHCPSPGLNLFIRQWSAVKYIHTAVKQCCRTFLSYTPETHTLKNLSLSPANHHSFIPTISSNWNN